MAISQYAELKTAVANWLSRSDLTARIPEFITLAETRLNFGDETPGFETPPLRTLSQETSTTLSTTSASVTLPADFLEVRKLYLTQGTDQYPLRVYSPENQVENLGFAGNTVPTSYSIEGDGTNNYLRLYPTPDATYSLPLVYFKKFTSFSGDTDTNWVLTNAPGAYLFSTLTEAFLYTRNMEQAQSAAIRTKGIVDGLNKAATRMRYGKMKLAARPGHSSP